MKPKRIIEALKKQVKKAREELHKMSQIDVPDLPSALYFRMKTCGVEVTRIIKSQDGTVRAYGDSISWEYGMDSTVWNLTCYQLNRSKDFMSVIYSLADRKLSEGKAISEIDFKFNAKHGRYSDIADVFINCGFKIMLLQEEGASAMAEFVAYKDDADSEFYKEKLEAISNSERNRHHQWYREYCARIEAEEDPWQRVSITPQRPASPTSVDIQPDPQVDVGPGECDGLYSLSPDQSLLAESLGLASREAISAGEERVRRNIRSRLMHEYATVLERSEEPACECEEQMEAPTL